MRFEVLFFMFFLPLLLFFLYFFAFFFLRFDLFFFLVVFLLYIFFTFFEEKHIPLFYRIWLEAVNIRQMFICLVNLCFNSSEWPFLV